MGWWWCFLFFFFQGGVSVWAKTALTQRKPSHRGQRKSERRRERQAEGERLRRKQRRPFKVFRVTAYSADIIKVRRDSTGVGEFPCYCHLLPSLTAFKWLTFPAFSCTYWYQMQPESETMAEHSVPICHWLCFQLVFFNLERTRLDASISPLTSFSSPLLLHYWLHS